jgi:hypothetical protein
MYPTSIYFPSSDNETFAPKRFPDPVAVVSVAFPVFVVINSGLYVKNSVNTLVEVEAILIVGVATIASLKVAVMVTVSDADKRLSESVSVRVTVGEVCEYKNPEPRVKKKTNPISWVHLLPLKIAFKYIK